MGAEGYIVAEIMFDRNDTADNYRRLGELLADFKGKHSWLTAIAGLEKLLAGECPDHFSHALALTSGDFHPLYDPLLVWGRDIDPGRAIRLLEQAIPKGLGRVRGPDPDNGL